MPGSPLAPQGDLDAAEAAHLAAIDWYGPAALPTGIAFSHSCLGFLAATRGDRDAARQHHRAALDAAIESADDAAIALALDGAAAVALADGATMDAARLLGAASARWAATSTALPTHREDVEAVTSAVRAALDPDTFAAAWREGATGDDMLAVASQR